MHKVIRRRLAVVALTVLALAALAATLSAQSFSDRIRIGLDAGLASSGYEFGGYNSTVAQVSGVNIPGSGVVIVPGTTAYMAGKNSSRSSGLAGGIFVNYSITMPVGPAALRRMSWDLEADIDHVPMSGTASASATLPATALTTGSVVTTTRSASASWSETLALRVGRSVMAGRYTAYALAGFAFANVSVTSTQKYAPTVTAAVTTSTPNVSYTTTTTHTDSRLEKGWSFGIGLERALTGAARGALEYRHSHVCADHEVSSSSAASPDSQCIKLFGDRVTARVSIPWHTLTKSIRERI
jgi:opacity protein-like surface antigen